MLVQYRNIDNVQVSLHILETKPSLFREVSGIVIKNHTNMVSLYGFPLYVEQVIGHLAVHGNNMFI